VIASTCDARFGLAALTEIVRGAGIGERADWLEEIYQERRAWETSVADQRYSDAAPLHYARICHDTADIVAEKDPEMPVFFDTGHLLSFASGLLPL
jgi:acetolactate synthase I/II/III large subunit